MTDPGAPDALADKVKTVEDAEAAAAARLKAAREQAAQLLEQADLEAAAAMRSAREKAGKKTAKLMEDERRRAEQDAAAILDEARRERSRVAELAAARRHAAADIILKSLEG
jgi:vacuolar-type H+-ATPase subunit H